MQKIRGFIYFENKKIEDLKNIFKNFNLDSAEMSYFDSLIRFGEKIEKPGLFISGEVNEKYSSNEITKFLRKEAGLDEKVKSCDISIENEDKMFYSTEGEIKGNYIGIRIKPPYEIDDIKRIAENIKEKINAKDVFIRTVEAEEESPLVCIDLITNEDFESKRKEFEEGINSQGLKLGEYTFIKLSDC